MDDRVLLKKLEREIAARKQAEAILEKKALELFETNKALLGLNNRLEEEIEKRSKELIESEIKYRGVIENMQLGLIEVDAQGIVTKVYPFFSELVGYTEEELLGTNPNDYLVAEEFRERIEQQNQRRGQGKSDVYELKLITKSGDYKWVLISGAPFYDIHGKIVGSLGIHYDITERKKLSEQLKEAKITAEKAQEAEKQFLANMSHEIRTPLNAIIGMSHLLKETELNGEQGEYLNVLMHSSSLLRSLITDILDFSKIDSGEIVMNKKPFNLHKLVSSLVKGYQVKMETKSVEVVLNYDPSIQNLVIGDELVLNQILNNLLSNAEKFTNEVTISVDILRLNSGNDQQKLNIEFVVRDTGIGISQENLLYIFDKFKQVGNYKNRSQKGTGLGLSITKKLIEICGGDIQAFSKENHGTKFIFRLSFEDSGVKAQPVAAEKQEKISLNKKIRPILIAEDNPLNQKYIISLMNKWQLPYAIANNGVEAVTRCRDTMFSIVLMDIQMPELDGFGATKQIRRSFNANAHIPIIAITASSILSFKTQAFETGMTDFMSKPFKPIDLQKILQKYLSIDTTEDPKSKYDIDKSIITELYGDDKEYQTDMFRTFLEVANEEITLLSKSKEANDAYQCSRIIHKLKPTFSMVGLPEITKQAEKLEKELSSMENLNNDYSRRIDDFIHVIKEHLPIIRAHLSNISQ